MKNSTRAMFVAFVAQSMVTYAQNPPTPALTEFEVASIRPPEPLPPGNPFFQEMAAMRKTTGGPGSSDPERILYSRMPLRMLLYTAYGVHPDQISGPNWLDSERFDINAKVPPGATKEQVMVMLRNLAYGAVQDNAPSHNQAGHAGV